MITKAKPTGISGLLILEWTLKIFCSWQLLGSISSPIMCAWELIQSIRYGEEGKPTFLLEVREDKLEFYRLLQIYILYRILVTSDPKKGHLQEFRCLLWVTIYAAIARSYDLFYDFYIVTYPDYTVGPLFDISYLRFEVIRACLLITLMTLLYKFWPQEDILENENSCSCGGKSDAETKERTALLKIDPSVQGYQLI